MLRQRGRDRAGRSARWGQRTAALSARSAGDDLIERDGELDTLAVALARLQDRVGGVVTIKAPAGLGKTTLLERATAGATRGRLPGSQRRPRPAGASLRLRRDAHAAGSTGS